MFPLENRSLLSEKISAFYQQGKDNDGTEKASKYFNKDGILNSKKIVKDLFPEHENVQQTYDSLSTFQYDDYVKRYKELLPIFQYSHNVIEHLRGSNGNNTKCHWMGRNAKDYLELYDFVNAKCETKTVEHILVLTSLLENALANIYFTETQGKQAPHLLRDLLSTKEIRQVFGIELIILLKILMGSPNSINLRNVVWHGFPKPLEIPDYYESILLVMIHSLSFELNSLNYEIKERPLVEDFFTPLYNIDNELKIAISNINKFETEIMNIKNDFATDYKPYWQQLFAYYKAQRYIELLILILPQIELLLRLHYGQINSFDISAKLDEYYITVDTIFDIDVMAPKLCDSSHHRLNKLLDFSAHPSFEGSFHLIYDIFLSPNGCRLRDKVSHGEVSLEALNNLELASIVFHIFLNLLTPLKCHTLKDYQSKLHLNCMNKIQLLETNKTLQDFDRDVLEKSSAMPEISLESPMNKVLIFQRHKKESEFMLIIKKVTGNIKQTLDNYKESIHLRSALMAQRELHSKRRKTLEKLQTVLPKIFSTLSAMWSAVNKVFCLLQADHCLVMEEETKFRKTLRFLKHSLSISENLVKYSHYDSNEWIKSLELCRKFDEFYNKLFLLNDL